MYSKELERLQKLLHFPEEVAILLTKREYELFNQVPPMNYVRQVTMELSKTGSSARKPCVQDLIQRFNEVLKSLKPHGLLVKCKAWSFL